MTDTVIRRATAADVPTIGRLGALLVQAHYDSSEGREEPTAPTSRLRHVPKGAESRTAPSPKRREVPNCHQRRLGLRAVWDVAQFGTWRRLGLGALRDFATLSSYPLMNDRLLRFYSGIGTDSRGRTLEDIWRFSHDELESVHDYIQWLFPLAERSSFNPDAPLVDEETAARFRSNAELRGHLQISLSIMLNYYFGDTKSWLTPHNHNFLRITRILKSLTLLGLADRARELLADLEELYRAHPTIIGATTLSYWRHAVEDV